MMDPITIASTFASIVGLLGVWKAEATAQESQDFQQFLDWLQRHRHEQVIALIAGSRDISEAIKAIVESQHSEVIAMLTKIDGLLSTVVTNIGTFAELATAIGSQSALSDQARSILRQMNVMGASSFLEAKSYAGASYHPHDGTNRRPIEITDPRFIEDDLMTLVEYGFLRLDYGGSGSRIFRITRAGAEIAP